MEFIHGNGVPGKNTAGSLGDIYVNDVTNEYFKCNLAIKISGSDGFEYEWKKMKCPPFECPTGKKGTDATPYMKQESEKRTSNVKLTSTDTNHTEQPAHRNYTQYSKKNKGGR